jgi:hypothetical protein
MKQFCSILLASIALLSISLPSHARFMGAPFIPEVDKRFNALENPSVNQPLNGLWSLQVARAQYDVAVVGGTSSATAKSLGVTLPKNSIIWDGTIYVDTAFVGSSSTVALLCGSAAILPAQGITSWSSGNIKAISAVGTAATAEDVGTSACAISVKNGTASTTAGKLTLWLQYVVHN